MHADFVAYCPLAVRFQVDKLIGRLNSAEGKPVYLEDHVFGLMDGVIGTVALGNIYGTEQFTEKKHFHDVLDEAMSAKASFAAEDFFPNAVGRLVDVLTGAASRREKVFRDLDAFFDVIIDQHLDPARATPENGPDLIDVTVGLMKQQYQLGSLSFTRDHIKGLLSVDKLISRLTSAGGKPVFLDDHIFGVMDGIIGTVALGSIYGTDQFAHKKHFHDVFDEAMTAKASFTAEDYFPNLVGRLVDRLTGVVYQRERAFKDLDEFYEMVIQQHLESSHAKPDNGPDLIDTLIGLIKEHQGSFKFTKDHVKGILSNVFGGAVDTSSVTMVWAMAEMVKNPTVLKKAQEDVRVVVGNKNRVQPEDIPKLKYLKMVVKETLRLHPTVPLLVPRETLRHVKICGYDVPAKTRLFVNTWSTGRDSASWDNPEKFNPDRFEGKDVDFNGTNFEFIPFGAGRRMCPGIAMGVATTEFTLANLLYCFDWELPEGVDKLIDRLTGAERRPVFLEDHIFRLMDGIIGTVAFGNIYGTERFAHKKHFHDVIDQAMSVLASFSAEDYFPNAAGRLIDHLSGAVSRREMVFRELDAFFDVIIEQHLDPSRVMPENGGDLIDVLIGLMKEHQGASLFGFNKSHIKALLSVSN
ncbi:hypothetical protein EJB05_03596, partial [Eragrostis curvula]